MYYLYTMKTFYIAMIPKNRDAIYLSICVCNILLSQKKKSQCFINKKKKFAPNIKRINDNKSKSRHK